MIPGVVDSAALNDEMSPFTPVEFVRFPVNSVESLQRSGLPLSLAESPET